MSAYKELYKAVVLGDSYTGKTNISVRFTEGYYSRNYIQTIGLDFHSKIMRLENGDNIKLQFWDTGGNKNYLPIITSYIRDVAGAIFVVDLTNKSSLNNIDFWIHKFKSLNNYNIPKILVGSKSDSDRRVVSAEECKKIAKEYDCTYIETSAKNNTNIFETFDTLVNQINENIEKGVKCGVEKSIRLTFEEPDDDNICLNCMIS